MSRTHTHHWTNTTEAQRAEYDRQDRALDTLTYPASTDGRSAASNQQDARPRDVGPAQVGWRCRTCGAVEVRS